MIDILSAISEQPNLDPKFKQIVAPTYYETLPIADYLGDPIGAELNATLDEPLARAAMVEALKRIVNREVLDKADRIVRRLQEHTEGVR